MLVLMAPHADSSAPPATPACSPTPHRWQGPVAGLVTILVVTVPTMVVAEDWRGHPMIDDAGMWWLVPAAVAVLAFFAGGMLSVRRPRSGPARAARGSGAAAGALVAAVAAAVLVGADGLRRLLFNPTLPSGVVHYWLEAAAVAVVVGGLGGAARSAWMAKHGPGL